MPVVDRTIDELVAMEAKLGESTSFEEAYPIYMAKRRLEETLSVWEADINRLVRGWTWAPPPQVQSQGGEQRIPTPVREKLRRSPVTTSRRPVPAS
jgi:hypothetical protein